MTYDHFDGNFDDDWAVPEEQSATEKRDLTKKEANAILGRMRFNAECRENAQDMVRHLMREFRERNGHLALGKKSPGMCFKKAFKGLRSIGELYKIDQTVIYEMELNIPTAKYNQSVMYALHHADPEKIREVWDAVIERKSDGTKLTARVVEGVIGKLDAWKHPEKHGKPPAAKTPDQEEPKPSNDVDDGADDSEEQSTALGPRELCDKINDEFDDIKVYKALGYLLQLDPDVIDPLLVDVQKLTKHSRRRLRDLLEKQYHTLRAQQG